MGGQTRYFPVRRTKCVTSLRRPMPASATTLAGVFPIAGDYHHLRRRTYRHHQNNKVDRLATLLKACTTLPHLKQSHAHIIRGHLHHNNSLAATLVSLYAALAAPAAALLVVSSVASPTLSLLNRAIRALSKLPDPPFHSESLRLYRRMVSRRIAPDNFTFPFLLNSCAAISDLRSAGEVHGRVVRSGFEGFLPVSNALIDVYGKCGVIGCAYKVFGEMIVRDTVSFNAVLSAHARASWDMASARKLFDEMPERNVISYNAMIVGYVNCGELGLARGVFDGMVERNVVSWTTMIVGYTKNGLIDQARSLFDEMPVRNLISWTAMITGYSQNGRPREALGLFRVMEVENVKPDPALMTGVISAVGQLGDSELAEFVGSYVDEHGIERNEKVLTSLVDMYAKCGNMGQACKVFDEVPRPDVYSYSALIAGLASHGDGTEALEVFERMQFDGVKPDHITFVGVLTACSHSGLVHQGLGFWHMMVEKYGIEHGPDHYACIVDMLGRAGRLKEAYQMVESMPVASHGGALGALLAACKMFGNVEIAESVAEKLFQLEPNNTGNYMLLAGVYASRGRWEDAMRIRLAMKKMGAKLLGCSWIEVSGHP